MKRVGVILIGISLCASAAHAYTAKQASACYPDAIRLCGAPKDWRDMPLTKRAGIIICMIAHQDALSAKCLHTFGR